MDCEGESFFILNLKLDIINFSVLVKPGQIISRMHQVQTVSFSIPDDATDPYTRPNRNGMFTSLEFRAMAYLVMTDIDLFPSGPHLKKS